MFVKQPQMLKHYSWKEYDNNGIWLFQANAIVIIITELVLIYILKLTPRRGRAPPPGKLWRAL